jgi:predicted nucleotidyltransferase
MLTREIAINTANEFVNKCKEKGIYFSNVILFGSSITGKAHEFSDIDLLLVSDQFGDSKWENAKLIAPINKKFYLIEPHTYPTAYFLKGDPFLNNVLQTGIALKVA